MDKFLFLLIGMLVGFLLTKIFPKKDLKSSGYLRLDHSDPDSPYLFLELKDNKELTRIYGCKRVLFDVKREDFVPQK